MTRPGSPADSESTTNGGSTTDGESTSIGRGVSPIDDELLIDAARGHLHDLPRNDETGLWLSVRSEDHRTDPNVEATYTLCRSANRGVAGSLYLLARLADASVAVDGMGRRAERAVDWLLAHHETPDDQLPGLHFGEAGVAVAIAEAVGAGLVPDGAWLKEYLDEALSGPLDWPDLTHGAAGQALAAFCCADALDRLTLARHAHRAVEYLLESQDADGGWTLPMGVEGMSGDRYTGFAHGVAGIVYALVEYERRCNGSDVDGVPHTGVTNAARNGARWLTQMAAIDEGTVTWPIAESADEAWHWWCHGAPGIALAYLRLYEATEDGAYAELAEKALSSLPPAFRASNLSQCHGLSGLGEIYLEASRVLDGNEWERRAHGLGELCVHLGRRSTVGGLTWPVEDPWSPTADLMVGSGGVAHFLLRLRSGSRGVSYPLLPTSADRGG